MARRNTGTLRSYAMRTNSGGVDACKRRDRRGGMEASAAGRSDGARYRASRYVGRLNFSGYYSLRNALTRCSSRQVHGKGLNNRSGDVLCRCEGHDLVLI